MSTWTKTQIRRKLRLTPNKVEPEEEVQRPFVVQLCSGSSLYWKTGAAWVPRSEAEVFTSRGPDLSVGHRQYLDEEPDNQK